MNRRQFTLGALSLVGGATFAARAKAESRLLVPGKDYAVLESPLPPTDKSTIEVLHSFAFGLRPCYELHRSVLQPWDSQRALDVKLTRVHPWWTPSWQKQQQALCTMQALHNESSLVTRAFLAYFAERRDIFSASDDFTAFLASIGYDRERVDAVYYSDEVRSKMSESSQRMYAYQMPLSTIVIDGRFRVDPSPTMMSTVDALVVRVRAERGGYVASIAP